MTDARLALSTAPSQEVAARIAQALVERRLAACVNIVPGLRSIYQWQGAVEQADESLLLIKTDAAHLAAAEAALQELHPYEVPEFVVLAIESGGAAYLGWIAESLDRR